MPQEAIVENNENNEIPGNEVETGDAQASAVSLEDIHSKTDAELAEFLQTPEALALAGDHVSQVQPKSELPDEDLEELSDEQREKLKEFKDLDDGEEDPEEKEEEEDEVADATAQLAELFKPFKANGREMSVDNVAEALQLMKLGAGYHKDKEAEAPYKKALKVLKARNITDPETLSFLLDLQEGKPEAIAKLLKDQNINPIDIDVTDGDNYESDFEDTSELDTVTEVLESIPSGEEKIKTLAILGASNRGGWDQSSKDYLFAHPESIKVLHEQVTNGQFDKITAVVDKRRALGQMLDLTYLKAYDKVGAELATNQGNSGIPKKSNESNTTSQKAKGNEAREEARRKAGGAPRSAPSNVPNAETFNPATATMEEVNKFIEDQQKLAR